MSINTISINQLPDEICTLMLSYLEEKDLLTCCQLSSRWNKLASDDQVWKVMAKKMFNGEIPEVSHMKSYLQKVPRSNKDLMKRIEEFLNKIALGQNGLFQCRFIKNADKGHVMTIKIKGTEDAETIEQSLAKPHIKEEWLATHDIGINRPIGLRMGYRYRLPNSGSLTSIGYQESDVFTHQMVLNPHHVQNNIQIPNTPFQIQFIYPKTGIIQNKENWEVKINDRLAEKIDELNSSHVMAAVSDSASKVASGIKYLFSFW